MSKAFLVAQREYVENLKTKTFWIGILSFPVILSLSILVPMWLESTKDTRKYAVIDQSGWLLPKVEERAELPDLEKFFLEMWKKPELLANADSKVIPMMDEFRKRAGKLSDEEVQQAAKQFSDTLTPGSDSPVLASLPSEAKEALVQLREEIRRAWKAMPPEEARKISRDFSKSRYQRIETTDSEEALKHRIDKDELFAYIVIGKDPLDGSDGCKYVSNNLTDESLKDWFARTATEVVRERRIADAKIDASVAKHIQEPLAFVETKVGKGGEETKVTDQDTVRQWAPVGFVYLLWISVFTVAQMLLTNTVEEKSNRIIEVLLSSVSPIQLMIGKIAGIAATGLTVLGSWIVFFFLGTTLVPKMLGRPLPIDFSIILSDPVYLSSFVAYFFLGYLLFAAILVGMGSVCNSLKEAQNLLQPVFILLIVPILAMMPIGKDPNGTLAKVMSFIPPFTPFVMMNRAAGPPTTFEYVATTILLVVSIIGAMWFAAKIFRIGILMTGKPPKFREILGWLRAPVGALPVRKEE
ncbi:MAG: ABC transporter permease [Planctomycetes bacterium]|nr:ABC transporter permease [Planctomycetota bacterium]